MKTNLGSRQLVAEQHVRGEGESGNEGGSARPEEDAPRVQVLATFETLQLGFAQTTDLLCEVLLPRVKLDDTNAPQNLAHHLREERGKYKTMSTTNEEAKVT